MIAPPLAPLPRPPCIGRRFYDQSEDRMWLWGAPLFQIGAILCTALWSFWAFAALRFDRNGAWWLG